MKKRNFASQFLCSIFIPVFLTLTFLLSVVNSNAQVSIIKDINTDLASIVGTSRFCKCGSYLYFASQTELGNELWRTDGTTSGTILIQDILPGSASGLYDDNFACANGQLIFAATSNETGLELWKTNGVSSGTSLLKDINPGVFGSVPNNFIDYNGKGYFFAIEPETLRLELWASDATSSGTSKILPIGSALSVFSVKSNSLGIYFQLYNQENNTYQLWRSDGSAAGTFMLKESVWIYELIATDTKIFFGDSDYTNQSLWVSDGTLAGTIKVKDYHSTFPGRFFAFKDKIVFTADGIMISDGTEIGTFQILQGTWIDDGLVYQNKFYGLSNGSSNKLVLFSTDGTLGGTNIHVNLEGVVTNYAWWSDMAILGDKFIFTILDKDKGSELGVSDRTSGGTSLLKDISNGTGSSNPRMFTELNNKLIFLANDSIHGQELWVTDGSSNGTIFLKDIRTGTESALVPNSPLLESENDILFFASKHKLDPKNFWKSDGTTQGTSLYYDFPGYPIHVGKTSSDLIFFTDKKFYKSNGLPNGTNPFKDLSPQLGNGYSLGFAGNANINGKLVFFFSTSSQFLNLGGEIWVTDGTDAGTFVVKDINPGVGSSMNSLSGTPFGNQFIFSADDGTIGAELWKTDGTTNGTNLIADINSGAKGSQPSSFSFFNGQVYFAADDGVNGVAMWKTNGTEAGTSMIKVFAPTGSPLPQGFTRVGSALIFTAYTEANGWSLWKSDGTTDGTQMIKDINTSTNTLPIISNIKSVGDSVAYFAGDDGIHGKELWVSDGTKNGTYLIDIQQGSEGSYPENFTSIESFVFFKASDKLWRTDGTIGQTKIIVDINPSSILYKDGVIYFIGQSKDYGVELFKVEYSDFITAVEYDEKSQIEVFPNPTTSHIKIKSNLTESSFIEISNMKGNVVSSFDLPASSDVILSVDNYTSGLYIIRILNSKGTEIKKFLKI